MDTWIQERTCRYNAKCGLYHSLSGHGRRRAGSPGGARLEEVAAGDDLDPAEGASVVSQQLCNAAQAVEISGTHHADFIYYEGSCTPPALSCVLALHCLGNLLCRQVTFAQSCKLVQGCAADATGRNPRRSCKGPNRAVNGLLETKCDVINL